MTLRRVTFVRLKFCRKMLRSITFKRRPLRSLMFVRMTRNRMTFQKQNEILHKIKSLALA
jgi:hypothetical protein